MMWQWSQHKPMQLHSLTATDGWGHVSAEESDIGREIWVEPEDKWIARWHGFCGLVNKP
jgi:hypothetical protein